ncbi:hypothetical protein LWC34_30295 [Kibdelosporangium philippinense]|uniref:DNA-binding transcriptional activator of the SARP family n=1 Tax=Kibdelosporangium philippinense TaxID=211113 RepID=A0ABS8ZHV5_9PSEU|nr:BTAD domain-containing putative transcriptional regulator [Kibdelosporangium philippinense]MCE7007087.1 hypothetical protein [Kibdelosporangium philippinense]
MLAATFRFAGRVVRGVLAVVVLVALVAGLPWALAHFVGWPLPDHVPTWDEIQATLLNPMSPQFLLDSMTVLCWIVWFFFTVDVLRCAVDAARGITWPQVRAPGPLHGLAAALIGTIVLTLLGNRTPYTAAATASAALASDLARVAVTAPLTPGRAAHTVAQLPAPVQHTSLVIDRAAPAPAPAGMVQVTEEVRLPQNGIYDSLWRIAERIYGPGGGNRWPELWAQNRGVIQPDGRVLTKPGLIRPGWKITAHVPALNPEQNVPSTPEGSADGPPSPPPSTPQTPTTQPTTPAGQQETANNDAEAGPGIDLATGAYVSLALAAFVASAVASAHLLRRRRYRIGSGDRDDLEESIAPVVRALRTACPPAMPVELASDDMTTSTCDRIREVLPAHESGDPTDAILIGVRNGRETALNLAAARGLGLVGPGASAAARALILHVLTIQKQRRGVRILIAEPDVNSVLGGQVIDDFPTPIVVVPTLDAALDELETTLLARLVENENGVELPPIHVLVGKSTPHAERRLQAVLDNGSTLCISGILIGQWRPGATIRVREDGTVTAASPGPADALAGSRLYNVSAEDLRDLLALLHNAEGTESSTPVLPNVPGNEPRGDHTDAFDSTALLDELLAFESLHLLEPEAMNNASGPKATSPPVERPRTLVSNELSRVGPRFDEPGVLEQPMEALKPLELRILGPVELTVRRDSSADDITSLLTPKQREVLVYLALHAGGVRREPLNDAVWPNSPSVRPYNSLHTALSLLRRSLANATDGAVTDLVMRNEGRYQLDSNLVNVDYWHFRETLALIELNDEHSLDVVERALTIYRGDLGANLGPLWIEASREAVRRDLLDALGAVIRQQTVLDLPRVLSLLESVRKLNPYNESIYRDIIRVQARLGQVEAVERTLRLLTTTLNQVGEKPTPETVNLAELLHRRNRGQSPPPASDAAAS